MHRLAAVCEIDSGQRHVNGIGKIKFQIWYLFIFLTVNHLKRSETQIVNSLTVLRLRAFLFSVDVVCTDYLGLREF